jgi:hypothetical protein
MELDLDTFLVTFYCAVDDLYCEKFAPLKPVRPGREPALSDSEVITLALLAQWHPQRSEGQFLRYVRQQWRSYFPRLLDQSAFNRRARDLMGVIARLGPAIAAKAQTDLGITGGWEVLDGLPIPLMRLCRGTRHRLFANEAGVGRGGSDREWYYGVRLVGSVNAAGFITGATVGPANTQERWLSEALLRWRHDPRNGPPRTAEMLPLLGPSHQPGGDRLGVTGPLGSRWLAGTGRADLYLADKGFGGHQWQRHWQDNYRASVLTPWDIETIPDQRERQTAGRELSSLRQVVETAYNAFTDHLGVKFPRAHTAWGLSTRIAAKIAAFDLAVYINHLFKRPPFALFNPLG